jgi:hypothetical protein
MSSNLARKAVLEKVNLKPPYKKSIGSHARWLRIPGLLWIEVKTPDSAELDVYVVE